MSGTQELPRYRLLQAAYIQPHPSQTMPLLLQEGAEIVYAGLPGPHMQPMNEQAHAKKAEFAAKYPTATLDPTRNLPNGIDPLAGHTLETALISMMRKIEAEGQPAAATAAESSEIKQLTVQIGALVAALQAALVPPKARN